MRSVRRLLVTANVPSSPILATLMMEALRFSETSVLTRAPQRKIPEYGILLSHRREYLKSCNIYEDFMFLCAVCMFCSYSLPWYDHLAF
jgi:hypothetical protein